MDGSASSERYYPFRTGRDFWTPHVQSVEGEALI
jgi:hypothetical protein